MDFLLELERESGVPLHAQLETQIREAIREGRLAGGVELPSTRLLAAEVGVSRGVVVECYAQLRAEGYLEVRRRGKTFVAGLSAAPSVAPSAPTVERPIDFDFHPGLPDLDGFPRAAWARATREVLKDLPGSALGYGDLRGTEALRESLAAHLARSRGLSVAAEQIVITQGFSEGLALLGQALRARGVERIGVEDPCLPTHRAIIEDAGIEAVPIPVDDQGMQVEQLERERIKAALLTPAHQFPVGVALTAERRGWLIDWARRTEALIIEDDYDAEYRYDRDPVGALQGLAPDLVLYGGSASKTLAPALRIGWLILPQELLGTVLHRKALASGPSPVPEQLTLARFIDGGDYHRHLRRMRRRYRSRRDALIVALERHLPGARLRGVAAGLHLLAELPGEVEEGRLAQLARGRGINVHPLGWHRDQPGPGPAALVLGYGSLAEKQIERGVHELAIILQGASGKQCG